MHFEHFFNKTKDKKNKSWEEALALVQHLRDKIGKTVDKNIEETIATFYLHGINTVASCEGHLDHGTYAPYIDIRATGIKDLEKKADQTTLKEQIDEIYQEITRKNLEERKKLVPLLDLFYKNRIVPFDRRLTIQTLGRDISRLESQGAEMQRIQNEDIREQKLVEYKKEMAEFTLFLKNNFFEKENQ